MLEVVQDDLTGLEWLDAQALDVDAYALAQAHMPILMLDKAEPYQPLVFGFTVIEADAQSPSSKFQILPSGNTVIEYAVWYDWDIQHLYDLEHVWVHVNAAGNVVGIEASRHGAREPLELAQGLPEIRDGHPVLYVEPGKHAHWAAPSEMTEKGGVKIAAMCQAFAGTEGVHVSNMFGDREEISATGFDHRLARLKMKRDAFAPSFEFEECANSVRLVPWTALEKWIPRRVTQLIANLAHEVPHLAAVLLDCGDTLIDENTEEKVEGSEVVLRADLIPGSDEMLHKLVRDGYRLALVADGPRATFENVLKQHGLWDCFEQHIISGDIGELKPSPKMFAAAFDALDLPESDVGRTVMIGNNLERDIRGANNFGIISVFLAWSKRRSHEPKAQSDRPQLKIDYISEFNQLLERIELSLPQETVI